MFFISRNFIVEPLDILTAKQSSERIKAIKNISILLINIFYKILLMNEIKIRNIVLLNALNEIDDIIKDEAFFVAVFKGAALLIKSIFKIDERQMSDIDLIIDEVYYDRFIELCKKNGFNKIEGGRNSYYKTVIENMPPIIIDVHKYFSDMRISDFELENIDGFNKIKVLSDPDLLITTVVHAVIKHGFYSKDDEEVFKRIFLRIDDFSRLKHRIEKFKLGVIMNIAFRRIGVKERYSVSFTEILSFPFVWFCFKKHFTLNEYILPFFYEREKVVEFLKSKLRLS